MIIYAVKTYEDYLRYRNGDETVQVIKAQDAIAGVTYYCLHCGCELFKKESINGVAFFSCYSGRDHHSNDVCRNLEKGKNKIETTDIPDFDLDFFWAGVTCPPSEKQDDKKSCLQNDCQSDEAIEGDSMESIWESESEGFEQLDGFDGVSDNEETTVETIKVVPIRDIKPLIDRELEKHSPNAFLNKSKNIRVKDILFACPFFDELFANPNLLNHQRRYVQMKPSFLTNDGKICCQAFNRTGQRIYFTIVFDKKSEYYKACKTIFGSKIKSAGNTRDISLYSSIFVGTEWVRGVDHQDKNNKNSVPCFVGVINNSKMQICAHKLHKIKK